MTHRAIGESPASVAFVPHAAVVVLVLATVTATLALREVALGKAEMGAVEDAVARSAWTDAIWHARAAAETFVPGSPWPERAMRRLDGMGREATIRGDRGVALLAYGAVRTAALATRAPGAPNTYWRSIAEEGLARLAGSSADASRSGEWASAMRADLVDPTMPSTWTLTALSVSALAILLGLVRLAGSGSLSSQVFVTRMIIATGFGIYAAVLLLS
jgi:hypothetical protein